MTTVKAHESRNGIVMHGTKERIRSMVLLGFAVFLFSALSGCGKSGGLERVAVSGGVTYQGEPVLDGQIRFVPKAGTKAPVTIEPVRDGQYNTETTGGVPVGSFQVMIRSYDPNEPVPMGPGAPPRTQFLPAKYNVQSVLELEVESGQSSLSNDFHLTP